ncbi:MAG TPA: CHASE domain-containing protein, partial [Acidimicrobiia bacterium]|nr:CHASE domain-containing protein [Acidimicrobiia bacterium]
MRARRLLVPALIVLLGISSSLRQYARATEAENAELTERLADAGDQLASIATDLFLVAAEQAQAIRGLYESSIDVTKEEFSHFASVMGTSTGNRMVFAARVPATELDEFNTKAILIEPDFRLHGASDQPRDEYWLLLFSSESDSVGYEHGFDFGSVPQIKVAIETSLAEKRAVASDLIAVPGDDEEGDLVVVSTIEGESAPIGAAIVTLRLDEQLAPRVEQLLGEDVRLKFGYEGPQVEPSIDQWSGTLDFAGQPVGLFLELESVERN